MCRSIAIWVSQGWASSLNEEMKITPNATATAATCGRRYVSSRRINRASYALPTTSSCASPASDIRQFLLEPLSPVHVGVRSAGTDEQVVRAALDDAAVLQDQDQVCVPDRRDAVRNDHAGAGTPD